MLALLTILLASNGRLQLEDNLIRPYDFPSRVYRATPATSSLTQDALMADKPGTLTMLTSTRQQTDQHDHDYTTRPRTRNIPKTVYAMRARAQQVLILPDRDSEIAMADNNGLQATQTTHSKLYYQPTVNRVHGRRSRRARDLRPHYVRTKFWMRHSDSQRKLQRLSA